MKTNIQNQVLKVKEWPCIDFSFFGHDRIGDVTCNLYTIGGLVLNYLKEFQEPCLNFLLQISSGFDYNTFKRAFKIL